MQPDSRVSILLVDDQPENLVALEAVLEDLGQNLVTATSGREALRRLLDEEFAVILLDVKMPEMDGFETAALIRERTRSAHTPIVFLTAYSKQEAYVSRAYSVGAVDYVFKPFDPEVLRAKVSAFVEMAKKTRQLQEETAQRREAEEQVRHLNADLERRVTERTAELEKANRALRREITERERAERERQRLLELEQTARARAEAVQQRLLFLGQASAILASSLDYATTLARVAELAVPYLADFCIVDLVTPEGEIRRATSTHADPRKNALLNRLQEEYIPLLDSPQPAARVLRTGRSELVERVDETWLRNAALDEAHLEIMRDLGPHSYLVVPLEARGHKLGVITLGTCDAGHTYTQEDLGLAEDLARRAAAAIDNARLFHEVEEAGRRKDEFLAMLAHELRNPLAAISSAAYSLEQGGAADPHRSSRLQSIISRQTHHLSRLVDDLLDVSRITQGRVDLRMGRVNLAQAIAGAVETTRPLIESRQQVLSLELPEGEIPLRADPTRLEQVLSNLLNNAAKYTDPGGRIWLDATVTDEAPTPPVEPQPTTEAGMPVRSTPRRGVAIRVRDTGVGIPTELQARIFDLFTQSSRSLDRAQGGLGIGLSLVKALVEKHGGTISVSSEGHGAGSEFTVHLPLDDAAEPFEESLGTSAGERPGREPPRETHPERRTAAPGKRRVLVVDDNVDAAQTLAELLELWGHEVHVALDGPDALEAARDYRPDVVLLDIGLPTLDGYQVARRLRAGAANGAGGEHPSAEVADPCVSNAGNPRQGAKTGRAPSGAATAAPRRAPSTPGHKPAPETQKNPDVPLLVALSGYGQPEDRRRSLEAGFHHHLTKPVDPNHLKQLLENGG